MDTFRQGVALVLAVFMPPVIVYWCVIHLATERLRRLGVRSAFTVVGALALGTMAVLLCWKAEILAGDYGLNAGLFGAGALLLAGAAWMRRRLGQHFDVRTLVGIPELSTDTRSQRLVTEGLHGRIRHPRYVQLMISMLGWALIANHRAGYWACGAWVAGVWGIAVLEERELRRRFGREYEDYCRRVPRFIPRRGNAGP